MPTADRSFRCMWLIVAPVFEYGWVSPWHFGLNEGRTILKIENYRTGLLWRLMRNCPYIVGGLRRAGFGGGWVSWFESSSTVRGAIHET
jgi:hypothetical protein